MSREVNKAAKNIQGNSGCASKGNFCITSTNNALKDLTNRIEQKGPRKGRS